MKIVILFLLITLSFALQGQDLLSRTQIFHAIEWQHPAMAGVQDKISADLMYRQALNSYGKESGYYQAGLFYPIKKGRGNMAERSGFKISNPAKARALYRSTKARRKQGIGMQLNAIKLGPLDRKEVKAFYAYHLPVSYNFTVSLGSSLKLQQNMIGFENLTVRDEVNDDFYQQIINSSAGKQSNLQFDIGAALYNPEYYFTFTAKSLFITELQNNEVLEYLKDCTSYSFLAGYKWIIHPDFSLMPNAEINYFSTYGMQYKGALRFKYKELIYLGAGLHYDLKYSALLGVNIPGNVFLHYSYDYYTGFIREFANGVHEVSLSYLFNNKNASTPFTW
ncbi:PorP/SprF family type IX secretion system membrane protein [Marivirga sp. S37H4]|uniref:PorP/SprF family type IX secretion system membrane protein n=1 Tax=Marivirga aurantiaca TaxID=2802615 RepID=A0A934X1D7_9BACT|nr:PorP/SprF family type IX secretion system membrane protein [Marivirga aurantiaca]MBK6266536.1 PorP/SprF family type IX secretion system membrane protein [Marivirga aurantiaca]